MIGAVQSKNVPVEPEPSRRFNLLFTVEGSGIQGKRRLDKSKMAVQQGKKTIDSITKSGFLQFLPSHCFETYSVKFYGKEKLSAKILRIYMIELDENSQNYPSIKVCMKWSLGQFERFIARNTVLC